MSKRSFGSDDDDDHSMVDTELDELTTRLGKRMVVGRRTRHDVLKDCQDRHSEEDKIASCVANEAVQEVFGPLGKQFKDIEGEQQRFVQSVLDDMKEDEDGNTAFFAIKTLMGIIGYNFPSRAVDWLKKLAEEDENIADLVATVILEEFNAYGLEFFTGERYPITVQEAIAVLDALEARGITTF